MKLCAAIFVLSLFQQTYSQCLPATAYCLSPPAVEVLVPSLPALPALSALPTQLNPCAAALPELLPALAPLLASTISSALAATLPPLLEAALPTVLSSALAATAPILAALPPSYLPNNCAQPLVYAAPPPAPTCIYL